MKTKIKRIASIFVRAMIAQIVARAIIDAVEKKRAREMTNNEQANDIKRNIKRMKDLPSFQGNLEEIEARLSDAINNRDKALNTLYSSIDELIAADAVDGLINTDAIERGRVR